MGAKYGARHYDVIVIGGGPAGLTAAEGLAKAGLKTLVLEKERIGARPRSWIAWKDDIVKLGFSRAILNEINSLSFTSYLGGKYDFNGTSSAVIDTKKLLLSMKQRAVTAGADVHELETFISAGKTGKKLRVRTGRGAYTASYCVDASGAYSIMQRKLGSGLGPQDFMGCYALEVEGLKIPDPRKGGIFDAALPGKDYFWKLPYNGTKALLGCFFFEELNARTAARAKASLKLYMKLKGCKGRVKSVISGNIPLMDRKHLKKDRVFFCGDAASSPLPSSGYGLLRAIHEAQILARDIAANFTSGKFSYRKMIMDLRYPGFELHYIASDILKNITDTLLDKAMRGMKRKKQGFIKDFLKGDDLSLAFVSVIVGAIFDTFTPAELTELALKKDYKKFLLHAMRSYPGAAPGVIRKFIKALI